MRKVLIVATMGMMMLAGVGCQDGKMCNPFKKKATTQSAEKDACPMCEGVQVAKSDGTCPKCGMKVKG